MSRPIISVFLDSRIFESMNYSIQQLDDTIVALSTPAGEGAIGVIRLSGSEAISLVNGQFQGKDLSQQGSHTAHFGQIVDWDNKLLDEVVVTVFKGPNSYTGEDVVEVSCHGSPYIIQRLLELLTRGPARLAQPGEFTMRAFLNGKMDLSQAEGVADLIASRSASTHRIALQQMRGGVSKEIQSLRQKLLDFASLIELELDFGEEDVEFADRKELKNLVAGIRDLIAKLIQSFQLGNAIKNGVNTVIAGRPNAGKSTLLNALLQEDRAIVSDIAGTTRDTIEEVLNIQGVDFRLIDTAGIRDAADTIEAMGVERTLEKIRQSAVLVYVFDVILTQPSDVQADLEKLVTEDMQLLIVANKMDLNPYTKFSDYFPKADGEEDERRETRDERRLALSVEGLEEPLAVSRGPYTVENWVPVSAINEMNIEFLKEKLYEVALSQGLSAEGVIFTNARHVEALQRADQDLEGVLEGLSSGIPSDLVALDIRVAMQHLGEITGEVSTDDLLGNIFGRFCIGK